MVSPTTNHSISAHTLKLVNAGTIPKNKVEQYNRFIERINREVMTHEVIANNEFTRWFKEGNLDKEDIRHFLVQFSVFSMLFVEAQLKKAINAPTLEAMRASKEILMNELGVVFRNPSGKKTVAAPDEDLDLVGTEGSVEGGTFRFAAAHFEWLLRMISHVGLEFKDVGKRRHGTKSTLFFCEELSRLYGSDDPHIGLGASLAVENWAAAGFWKELIEGLQKFKKRYQSEMPLAFFLWHDRIEDQHAAHTWIELEEEYFAMELDEEKFFIGAKEMLHGVNTFWKGLNQDRLKRPR
jgi:hypothetical protein